MFYFDGVIVVEGKGDVSYLSSFINAEYVILNGYDMPDDVLDYLTNIKNRKIVVLTDPDEAGICIENKLRSAGFIYEYKKVNIKSCDKNGKHGIAECEKSEILRVFNEELINDNPFKNSLSKAEFNELGMMESQKNRDELSKIFHLGFCNAKTLYKRLNYNGITAKDIKEKYGN